jgi:hypothetical protein
LKGIARRVAAANVFHHLHFAGEQEGRFMAQQRGRRKVHGHGQTERKEEGSWSWPNKEAGGRFMVMAKQTRGVKILEEGESRERGGA